MQMSHNDWRLDASWQFYWRSASFTNTAVNFRFNVSITVNEAGVAKRLWQSVLKHRPRDADVTKQLIARWLTAYRWCVNESGSCKVAYTNND